MPHTTHLSDEQILAERRRDLPRGHENDLPPLVPEIGRHSPICRCPACKRERELGANSSLHPIRLGRMFGFV